MTVHCKELHNDYYMGEIYMPTHIYNSGQKSYGRRQQTKFQMSIQPPIQRVPGALSVGEKPPGCEADHSPSA
jgi:hypothetical protein